MVQQAPRWLVAGLLVGGSYPGSGAQYLESALRLNGKEVLKAFEPVRAVLQRSSAVIYDGRLSINYGVVVRSDGYVAAKHSEIKDVAKLSVRVDKELFEEVEIVGVDTDWDLALLKVEARDLVPVHWAPTDEELHGTWVVTNGSSSRPRRRPRVGVVSANTRPISDGVVLGVVFREVEGEITIEAVAKESGAAAAGIKEGDVIVACEGKAIGKKEELSTLLEDKRPGDRLEVELRRGDKTLKVEVELKIRKMVFAEQSRNQEMSGRTSKRRTFFDRVIQTDLMLKPRRTGGPLLNLEGKCLGMVIARSDRAETFAIPSEELQEVVDRLREESLKEEPETPPVGERVIAPAGRSAP